MPAGKFTAPMPRRRKVQVRGLLGLKVKHKWLQQMAPAHCKTNRGLFRQPKRVELRGYHYKEKRFLPRGAAVPKCGDKILLLCNGHVWGSARLGRVRQYHDMQQFDADANRHHVTPRTARGSSALSYKSLRSKVRKGKVFGWSLSDFRWHNAKRRPKAKHMFRLTPGSCGKRIQVPDFLGQEKGQVWYNGGVLPQHLCASKTSKFYGA
mmetsp:Transcript_8735/g.24643  ORF Transcript_8735/g.24643 Transcript_8735/m.24643 type:complete len:208 (-) Transcript_8735:139-762(-)